MGASRVLLLGLGAGIVEGVSAFSGKPPLQDILILASEVYLLHLLHRRLYESLLLLPHSRGGLWVLRGDDEGVLEVIVVPGEASGLLADEELLVLVVSCVGREVRERL
jgi:hypothetical protein